VLSPYLTNHVPECLLGTPPRVSKITCVFESLYYPADQTYSTYRMINCYVEAFLKKVIKIKGMFLIETKLSSFCIKKYSAENVEVEKVEGEEAERIPLTPPPRPPVSSQLITCNL
jgi:hypothetical protein